MYSLYMSFYQALNNLVYGEEKESDNIEVCGDVIEEEKEETTSVYN